ncbi:unnamed protein product [Agarophyton chilense]
MDLRGQYRSEKAFLLIMWPVTLLAALLTFALDRVNVMFFTFAAGLGLSALICLPEWPFFNRNALAFVHRSHHSSPHHSSPQH